MEKRGKGQGKILTASDKAFFIIGSSSFVKGERT
jgi:hypothetical protein